MKSLALSHLRMLYQLLLQIPKTPLPCPHAPAPLRLLSNTLGQLSGCLGICILLGPLLTNIGQVPSRPLVPDGGL